MHQEWHTFAWTGHRAVMSYETRFLFSTYARLYVMFLYWYFKPTVISYVTLVPTWLSSS